MRCHNPWGNVNVSALAGSRFELGYPVGGHPAAVFYLNALRPGPLPDLGGVQAARRYAAAAAGWLAGAAADPAGGIDVPGQRIAQLPGVCGVQVDLIPDAVQSEADGTAEL